MSRQTSTKLRASQQDSTLLSEIATRLREERCRLEPVQGRFADRIGITQGKLSHLETGRSEAKAEDLAAAAFAGVDIHYVLTGERREPSALDRDTVELVLEFEGLPPHLRSAALGVVQALARGEGREAPPSAATVHAPRRGYRGAEAAKRG
jgi:transcriptional regulator with XRE-family HTH domain